MEHEQPVATDTSSLPTNGHARAATLSSNMTLFWRVFVPVFGTVFFTGLLLATWLTDEEELYLSYSVLWIRVPIALIWLAWALLVWKKLWPLRRVDADDAYLFVTNYWTTLRYLWADVERIEERRHWGRLVVHLHLKAPGRWGNVIHFLPGSHYRAWMEENHKAHLLPVAN